MTTPHHATAWHALGAADAVATWESSAERGLPEAEAGARLVRLGPNALPEPPRPSTLARLFAQFANPLVGALLVAAVIAVVVAAVDGEGTGLARFGDPLAILFVVILNALLGFVQERRAERAVDALRRMAAPNARVVRDSVTRVTAARELVPGDLVELEAGDAVPADLRLVETASFATEEAALTGESTPVAKDAQSVLPGGAELAERLNMAFLGTAVVRGRGKALVVATGEHTELGKIGVLLHGVERRQTPLEARLAALGRAILVICIVLSALLFAIGLLRETAGVALLLLTAVSLAVAAIPESLPAVTTITLALGVQQMARRGAIVRKLAAVETLGSATIICSDKTGTLTENAMTVRLVETIGGELAVTGEGYEAGGLFLRDGTPVTPGPAVRALCETAVACNTARIEQTPDGRSKVIGDPTEAALLVLARKGGIAREDVLDGLDLEREIPFDAGRRSMVVVFAGDGARTAHVKGSPEKLLPLCTRALGDGGPIVLDDAARARLLTRVEEHAGKALRLLALARRDDPGDDPEQDLTLLGIVGMVDPPRPGVTEAIAACKAAGVRVAMITGDHRLTAISIARELGIWDDATSIAVTGAELEAMDDQKLQDEVHRISVFARVSAEQKLLIVRALRERGDVVAMTGDGVNDAPALREADIGVAMGLSGTDVAREAAAMVLADDNFATIVHAVRGGRAIFRNIQKFIFFLNSSNAGLVLAVIAGAFIPWMPALMPIQLLWINLVTNGLPALALGLDPPERSQMREPPRPVAGAIVGWRDMGGVALVGCVLGLSALAVFFLPDLLPRLFSGERATALHEARTMAFAVLALGPMFHAFNARSPRESILTLGLFTNRLLWGAIAFSAGACVLTIVVPDLRPIFHTTSLAAAQWAVVLALSFLPLPVVEIGKLVDRWAHTLRGGGSDANKIRLSPADMQNR